MQELEKILEEIQELRGKAGSECTSEDHYIKKAWELWHGALCRRRISRNSRKPASILAVPVVGRSTSAVIVRIIRKEVSENDSKGF